jgi:hypothetical protein
MSKPLLPLCSIPTVADKDGDAGANAKFLLPFYGYWAASGQVFAFPLGNAAQDPSMRIGGVSQPDTFQKDCCTCAEDGVNLVIPLNN